MCEIVMCFDYSVSYFCGLFQGGDQNEQDMT